MTATRISDPMLVTSLVMASVRTRTSGGSEMDEGMGIPPICMHSGVGGCSPPTYVTHAGGLGCIAYAYDESNE